MSWADTAAVLATIRAVPAIAASTYLTRTDGGVQAGPYVIVHPSAGNDAQTRLSGPRLSESPSFVLHICGSSAEAVIAIAELVKAKFVVSGFFVPPTVSGRNNENGWWHSPLPVQIDTDVLPPIVYVVIELGWVSDPS